MIQASIYGRLGRDPQTRQTKNGSNMVTASIAVDATPGNHDGDQETIWFQVLAFGKVGDTLARHQKGDLVSMSGRITQSRWTSQAGEEKTGMTIIADTVISAKSVRPGGGRKKADAKAGHKPGPTEYATNGGAAGDFNDDIPF
jgi:single-strand DNA-binding protein